jgi:hypothetical protein
MSYIEFDKIDGLYSGDHRRVAEVISDLFPTVRLIRVDSLHPAYDPQRPFALVDEPHMLPPYVIRYMRESEVDQRLVAWLVENNMHDANSKVNRLKILEMAEAAMKAKRELEWMGEKKDMMKSVMKSKKHEYRHNGKVISR